MGALAPAARPCTTSSPPTAGKAQSPADIGAIEGVSGGLHRPLALPLVEKQGPTVDHGRRPEISVRAPYPSALIFGPCSVESAAHVERIAERLAERGVRFLRGGAYKPRTSPYAFQGHGEPALLWMRRAADAHGLKVVTEALAEADVDLVAEHADLVQVGSRNMHNYALLKAIGRTGRPALLKRGMAATARRVAPGRRVPSWAGAPPRSSSASGGSAASTTPRATCSTWGRSRSSPTSTTSR